MLRTSTHLFTSIILAFLLLLAAPPAWAATLFGDSFESDDLREWSVADVSWDVIKNQEAAKSGDYRAEIYGSTTISNELVKYVSTAGFEHILLDFWYQIPTTSKGYEGDEIMSIAYTSDSGANWTEVKQLGHADEVDDWTKVSIPLPDATSEPGFGIRFMTTAANKSDIFKLDAVSVSGDEVLDEDGDGVIEGDMCPETGVDEAGSTKLNPNHWRYDGSDWLVGQTKGNSKYSAAYIMSDTRGCNCDQIVNILKEATGEDYGGQRKFGCTAGTIEEFMELIW